ncbi:DUF2577 domain-containing protein [Jeotgalibacillus malaysiensis]|uniref:DUF2577 domain-containing protein n=1 Tax=Jeotgalibacillus malaysiensis TaxID=1508404 RepID=UPI00384CD9E2
MSLKQKMLKIAEQAQHASSPVMLVKGEVVSPPPNISVRLKSNSKLVIPSSMIMIAEHLKNHSRQIRVNGGSTNTYEFMDELKSGDKVMVASIQGGQSFFIIDRY